MKLQNGQRYTIRTAANPTELAEVRRLVHEYTRGATILTGGEGLWTDAYGTEHVEASCSIIITVDVDNYDGVSRAFKLQGTDEGWLASRVAQDADVRNTVIDLSESMVFELARAINEANDQRCCLVESEPVTYRFI